VLSGAGIRVTVSLKLMFCLFAYRPYGGLQRSFLRIAESCRKRGHKIQVLTMEWQGQTRDDMDIEVIPVRQLRNHARSKAFATAVQRRVNEQEFDLVIGFNRMPGLDVYYAADPCYEAKIRRLRNRVFRLTGRYRHFAAFERAVFGPEQSTQIITLAEHEIANFVRYYQTPRERFHVLPPGIARDRCASDDREIIRQRFRAEFGLADRDYIVLMVGSGFKTKGLDRALHAMAALPGELRARSRLLVLGEDRCQPFVRLAKRLNISNEVVFMGGRTDVPRFLAGSDVLIHPAYSENAGMVILEAMVAGLPVLTTDVCGNAHHVLRAGAGNVIPSPFEQAQLNQELVAMHDNAKQRRWSMNGIRYGKTQDLYSMPERAADFIEHCAESRA